MARNSDEGRCYPSLVCLPEAEAIGAIFTPPPSQTIDELQKQLGRIFPGRLPVIIEGSNLLVSPEGAKQTYDLNDAVKAFSTLLNDDSIANRILLIGSNAHGGNDKTNAWDNEVQEAVFKLTRLKGIPFLKICFTSVAVTTLTAQPAPTPVVYETAAHQLLYMLLIPLRGGAFEYEKQVWKASVWKGAVIFGGGPRSLDLFSSEEGTLKDNIIIIPTCGGFVRQVAVDIGYNPFKKGTEGNDLYSQLMDPKFLTSYLDSESLVKPDVEELEKSDYYKTLKATMNEMLEHTLNPTVAAR